MKDRLSKALAPLVSLRGGRFLSITRYLIKIIFSPAILDFIQNLMAPDGCRQYFKDTRGNLKSFNFDGRSELALNLNYAICVK